jgi:hypothetical protein
VTAQICRRPESFERTPHPLRLHDLVAELATEFDGLGRVERLVRPDRKEGQNDDRPGDHGHRSEAVLPISKIEPKLGHGAGSVAALAPPSLDERPHGDQEEPEHHDRRTQDVQQPRVRHRLTREQLQRREEHAAEERGEHQTHTADAHPVPEVPVLGGILRIVHCLLLGSI